MYGNSTPQHSNCSDTKYNKPYFIVWYNHSYMALVLPPVLLYLAFAKHKPRRLPVAPTSTYEQPEDGE